MERKTFYITWGGPFIDSYGTIMAPDYDTARKAAFDLFGRKWCMIYPEGFDKRHCAMGEMWAIETDEHLNYRRLR